MTRSQGRAYLFIRWSASSLGTGQLGDIGWAFEYNDRLGRFFCFYGGGTEGGRASWLEKCSTMPELIQAMSSKGPNRPGYDDVKVFPVDHADPDAALQTAERLCGVDSDTPGGHRLMEVREILSRYGVRGLAACRPCSAPFLWYNMLPGRSVPLRRLPVHLLALESARHEGRSDPACSIEHDARQIVMTIPGVVALGRCTVGRTGSGFLVGLKVVVPSDLSMSEGNAIAKEVEHAIPNGNPRISSVFVQLEAAA